MRTPVLVLGLVGAAFLGAAFSQVIAPSPLPAPAPVPVPFRLEARLTDLEDQVAMLRTELSRPSVVAEFPRTLPPPEAEVKAATASAAGAPDGGAAPAASDDEYIEKKVREVVSARKRAALDAQAKREASSRAAKDDQFLTRLQTALDLTEFQRDELKRHLDLRRAALATYKRRVKAGGDGISKEAAERYRQQLVDFVAEQDVEMTKLLGAEKFDRLMELTSPKKKR